MLSFVFVLHILFRCFSSSSFMVKFSSTLGSEKYIVQSKHVYQLPNEGFLVSGSLKSKTTNELTGFAANFGIDGNSSVLTTIEAMGNLSLISSSRTLDGGYIYVGNNEENGVFSVYIFKFDKYNKIVFEKSFSKIKAVGMIRIGETFLVYGSSVNDGVGYVMNFTQTNTNITTTSTNSTISHIISSESDLVILGKLDKGIFVSQISQKMEIRWAFYFNTTSSFLPNDITRTTDGSFIISISNQKKKNENIILKLSSEGKLKWTRNVTTKDEYLEFEIISLNEMEDGRIFSMTQFNNQKITIIFSSNGTIIEFARIMNEIDGNPNVTIFETKITGGRTFVISTTGYYGILDQFGESCDQVDYSTLNDFVVFSETDLEESIVSISSLFRTNLTSHISSNTSVTNSSFNVLRDLLKVTVHCLMSCCKHYSGIECTETTCNGISSNSTVGCPENFYCSKYDTCTPYHFFSAGIREPSTTDRYGRGAIHTRDGGMIVLGEACFTPCAVNPDWNFVLYKFSKNGELEWRKVYDYLYEDFFAITEVNGFGYIAAGNNEAGLLFVGVDTLGNVIYAKEIDEPTSCFHLVSRKESDGEYYAYCSGYYPNEAYFLKIHAYTGNVIWERTSTGPGTGNWERFSFSYLTSDGNIVAVGGTTSPDPWVCAQAVKFTPDGDILWSLQVGDGHTNHNTFNSMVETDKYYYVLGMEWVSYYLTITRVEKTTGNITKNIRFPFYGWASIISSVRDKELLIGGYLSTTGYWAWGYLKINMDLETACHWAKEERVENPGVSHPYHQNVYGGSGDGDTVLMTGYRYLYHPAAEKNIYISRTSPTEGACGPIVDLSSSFPNLFSWTGVRVLFNTFVSNNISSTVIDRSSLFSEESDLYPFEIVKKCWSCGGILKSNESSCSELGGSKRSYCESMDNCICNSNYTGDSCEQTTCFDISYDSPSTCNGHGNCTDYDKCICDDYSLYWGENCETWKCNNILNTQTSVVCSGQAECVDKDDCDCPSKYGGQWCEIWTCFNISAVNSSSCGVNGDCIKFDDCECDAGYYPIGITNETSPCSQWKCGNFESTDISYVCSGRGTCLSPNECECLYDYDGSECELWSCAQFLTTQTSKVCNGKGICLSPEVCSCNDTSDSSYFGYFGKYCEIKMGKRAVLATKNIIVIFFEIREENLEEYYSLQMGTSFKCSKLLVIKNPTFDPALGNFLRNCSLTKREELLEYSGTSRFLKIDISHLSMTDYSSILKKYGEKLSFSLYGKNDVEITFNPDLSFLNDNEEVRYTMRSFSKPEESQDSDRFPSPETQICKSKLHLQDVCFRILHDCLKSESSGTVYSVGYYPSSIDFSFTLAKIYFSSEEDCKEGINFDKILRFSLVSCYGSSDYSDNFYVYERCSNDLNSILFDTQVLSIFFLTSSPLYVIFGLVCFFAGCCGINIFLYCCRRFAKKGRCWLYDWYITSGPLLEEELECNESSKSENEKEEDLDGDDIYVKKTLEDEEMYVEKSIDNSLEGEEDVEKASSEEEEEEEEVSSGEEQEKQKSMKEEEKQKSEDENDIEEKSSSSCSVEIFGQSEDNKNDINNRKEKFHRCNSLCWLKSLCCCCLCYHNICRPCIIQFFKCLMMLVAVLGKEGFQLWFSSSEFLSSEDIDPSNENFVALQSIMSVFRYLIWASIGIYLFILFSMVVAYLERFFSDPLMWCIGYGSLKELVYYRIFKSLFLCWFISINLFCYIIKFQYLDSYEKQNALKDINFYFSIVFPETLLIFSLFDVVNYNGVSSYSHMKRLKSLGPCQLLFKFPKVNIGFSQIWKDTDAILEDFFQILFLIEKERLIKQGTEHEELFQLAFSVVNIASSELGKEVRDDIKREGRSMIEKMASSDEYGHLNWNYIDRLSFEQILYLKNFFFPREFLEAGSYWAVFHHHRMASWKWVLSFLLFPLICMFGSKKL